MRTLLLVLLLASAAAAAPNRTDDVAALYRRLEGLPEDARASPDSLRRLEEVGDVDTLFRRSRDCVAAAELRLLGEGKDRAFQAAMAAWQFLAATKAGRTAEEADRRRARRLYDLACGACAAAVDWSKPQWEVAGVKVRLVRNVVPKAKISAVVPAGLQPTEDFGRLIETEGVGGAVFVVLPESKERASAYPYLPPIDFAYAATALLRVVDGELRFELIDPLARPEVECFGEAVPLRANYTAPFAWMTKGRDPDAVAMEGMKTPRLDLETLYVLEPPRDDKVPVLFVHGLKSSPRAYRKMALALRADPEIRRRFQFVVYQYPTGYPIALLNMRLRKVLADFWTWFDREAPQARKRGYVAVGHSLGGLQVRSLATSSGRRLWDVGFDVGPKELGLDGPEGDVLRRMLMFAPDPKLARLVFLAVPHRGSPLATGPVAAISHSMIEEDPVVRHLRETLLLRFGKHMRAGFRAAISESRESVENLDPKGAYLQAFGALPIRPGLPFHSIIGDLRGNEDAPTGDGVVPYESAHLEGAVSELIVKSGHSVQATPEAIAEVKRILLLHLEK